MLGVDVLRMLPIEYGQKEEIKKLVEILENQHWKEKKRKEKNMDFRRAYSICMTVFSFERTPFSSGKVTRYSL